MDVESTSGRAHSPAIRITCAVLIVVPVLLALCVPLYQRVSPTLFGLPFFYWFQIAMAIAAACGCGGAYALAFRGESDEPSDEETSR